MKEETTLVAVSAGMEKKDKRLLFDRRYGWVFDEWKEPSEEALSGGRGMFCILPLTKALLQKSSESINFVASSMLKVMETPELISPKAVQSTLTHHVHNIASSMKKIEFSLREASTRMREEN